MTLNKNLLAHICDISPFFGNPMVFLEELRAVNYLFLGYDCSTQLAIRLIRWSQSIQLTPRQTYVMEQIVSAAIQRWAVVLESKIRATDWSIPDHRDDHHDLAVSAATKALQHLVEKHDLTAVPHPNIKAFVEIHTRFSSRDALEDFIYRKRLQAESTLPYETTFTKAHMERAIRQKRSLLKSMPDSDKKKHSRDLEIMEATLCGIRSEIRLDLALEESSDHDTKGQHGRLSTESQIFLSTMEDDQDDAECHETPDDQREFLNLLIQVGHREVAAKVLIPYLAEAREFRAILGLLRILKRQDDGISEAARSLRKLLGNRGLADLRKQILRTGKQDNENVVALFDACRAFLTGVGDESGVLDSALQVAILQAAAI